MKRIKQCTSKEDKDYAWFQTLGAIQCPLPPIELAKVRILLSFGVSLAEEEQTHTLLVKMLINTGI